MAIDTVYNDALGFLIGFSALTFIASFFEWFGLAVAAMTPTALAFALFAIASLLPRAIAHYRRHQQTCDD